MSIILDYLIVIFTSLARQKPVLSSCIGYVQEKQKYTYRLEQIQHLAGGAQVFLPSFISEQGVSSIELREQTCKSVSMVCGSRKAELQTNSIYHHETTFVLFCICFLQIH